MRYFVYIIKSEKDDKNYIGFTSDIKKRLEWHNAGKNVSTRYRIPFHLIYYKEFGNKASAMKYETWLKRQKGGIRIKKIINTYSQSAEVAQW